LVGRVAKDFDLTGTGVREWVKQAERAAGTATDGRLTSDERGELARLRRRTAACPRTRRSSNERQLSSRRRTGERVPVHEAENAVPAA
jgi:transposase-like protein